MKMPFGDRTGPRGLGPVAGRAAGYCSGFGTAGSLNPLAGGLGFGFGRRRGKGCRWFGESRGQRNCYRVTGVTGWARGGIGYPSQGINPNTDTAEYRAGDEMSMLKNQAEVLKKTLDDIQKRINMLEKAKREED